MTTPPGPPSGTRKNTGIVIAVAVVFAALLIAGIALFVTESSSSTTFELTGKVEIVNSNASTWGTPTTITTSTGDLDFECAGTGRYSDLGPDTAVVVTDETGTRLANGTITGSFGSRSHCTLSFSVEDVPRGEAEYRVEVPHHDKQSYTESEARDGLGMILGN